MTLTAAATVSVGVVIAATFAATGVVAVSALVVASSAGALYDAASPATMDTEDVAPRDSDEEVAGKKVAADAAHGAVAPAAPLPAAVAVAA